MSSLIKSTILCENLLSANDAGFQKARFALLLKVMKSYFKISFMVASFFFSVTLVASIPPAAKAFDEAAIYLPKVVGEIRTTKVLEGDTLMDIALREGFGFDAIANSNSHLDPWIPEVDAEVLLPGRVIVPRGAGPGILINLAEMRLFFIEEKKGKVAKITTYPLGIGRKGRETPEGFFNVVIKKEAPYWRVPQALRERDPSLPEIMPPGPQNPLGSHWLGISAPGYGIHGTNRPYGVGRRISYGCLRMFPSDIVELYNQIEAGTPVIISYQPIKAAWENRDLLLEVHPDYLERYDDLFQHALTVISKTGWPGEIDYAHVKELLNQQKNWPQVVGRQTSNE